MSKASGIEPQKVIRILTMLAPIVLAAYSRHKQSQASSGQSETSAPGGCGVFGDIIDRIT